jgi:hypothetical protein
MSPVKTQRAWSVIGYGLRNGGIGCLEMTREEANVIWCLEGSQTNGSAVSTIKCGNLSSDEQYHSFIVARDHGSIEIY